MTKEQLEAEKAQKIAQIEQEYNQKIEDLESDKCNWQIAWYGRCNSKVITKGFCKKHINLKCCVCGQDATNECEYAGSLICGAPLCDKCEHTHRW